MAGPLSELPYVATDIGYEFQPIRPRALPNQLARLLFRMALLNFRHFDIQLQQNAGKRSERNRDLDG